jgi:phenylacetic acid degradation operon negative regulatory protein
MRMLAPITIAALVEPEELRAAGFIVTLYGDVVEPRGGLLWMGTLVEVCALVGISETRVRTAVSRLVASGRLEGMREGRRSYYRLTEPARREFAAATALVFAPPPRPHGWLIAGPADPDGQEALAAAGFAPLGAGLMIGPDHRAAPDAALAFGAEWRQGRAALRRFVGERWDLAAQAAAYDGFLLRFAPLSDALEPPPGAEVCFVARTLIVHAFRGVVLRDPRLPAEALPDRWPETRARALFADLYARLSPSADSFVSRAFASRDGPLPAETDATRRRLDRLAVAAAP